MFFLTKTSYSVMSAFCVVHTCPAPCRLLGVLNAVIVCVTLNIVLNISLHVDCRSFSCPVYSFPALSLVWSLAARGQGAPGQMTWLKGFRPGCRPGFRPGCYILFYLKEINVYRL